VQSANLRISSVAPRVLATKKESSIDTRYRFDTHLIVHVIPVAHVVACAGASLNVPPHVELDLLAAHASARSHHRVPHTITAGAIHSRITLIQVTPTGIIVSESAGAPGIRGVSHPGLRTFLVTQSRLRPMECRGYVLKESQTYLPLLSTRRYFHYAPPIIDDWQDRFLFSLCTSYRTKPWKQIPQYGIISPPTYESARMFARFVSSTNNEDGVEHDLVCIGRDMVLFVQ